jgi:hypothetical protein
LQVQSVIIRVFCSFIITGSLCGKYKPVLIRCQWLNIQLNKPIQSLTMGLAHMDSSTRPCGLIAITISKIMAIIHSIPVVDILGLSFLKLRLITSPPHIVNYGPFLQSCQGGFYG